MLKFFEITNTAFLIGSYPLSYLELTGTVVGLIAVWLAARQKIISWPLGLINVSCFFVLFYQVRLYSDVFLQFYFFIMNIYGWVIWHKQKQEDEPPARLQNRQRILLSVLIVLVSILLGFVVSKIHWLLPSMFPKQAAHPYPDAFIAVASMVAQVLLARRVFENWFVWAVVNIVCVFVFYAQGIYLVAAEYVLFFLISLQGIFRWKKVTNTFS